MSYGFPEWWLAPAKLNLMLRILGRRADGYHNLQTVFQFVDLADRLSFQLRNDGLIRRLGGAPGIDEADDLVVRAATLLQQSTHCPQGVTIRLEKQIPLGGGLGGGSSDAATCLHALNLLWKLGLQCDQLAELGQSLGADVPVFVRGEASWGEGIGERLLPMEIPELWYLVVFPGLSVSTAAIFNDGALTRNSSPITIADFQQGDRRNDCLPVVRRRHPEIGKLLDWLNTQMPAYLTGTGSCLFAVAESRMHAEMLQSRCPVGVKTWVARGCNRSPLLEQCVVFG